jgi:hypothetical protein
MPIVFVAFVDGLTRLGARPPVRRWAAVVCATVTTLLLTVHIVRPAALPWTEEQVATARGVLARIPDGADVAASNRLAPHLTGRCRVQLFPRLPAGEPLPDWVAVARPFSWPAPETHEARLDELRATGYEIVTDLGHITLLHRR